MAQMICPVCGATLHSQLVEAKPGYTQVWTCPNAGNHGKTVECEHCGEQVTHPRYHWYSVKGLLGSGRWICFPPLPPTCYEPALVQPPEEPDTEFITHIRMGGYVVCGNSLPCPDHPAKAETRV